MAGVLLPAFANAARVVSVQAAPPLVLRPYTMLSPVSPSLDSRHTA